MKLKKIIKIIAFTLISLSILAVILSFGINYFINKELPKIIQEKNDTEYSFLYDDIDFSVFNNTLSVNGIKIEPKKLNKDNKKIHLKAKIESIDVSGVNFYDLLKHKNLNAFTIHIINPDITVYKNKYKDSIKDEKSKLPGSINIDKIAVKNANLKVLNSSNDTILNRVYNLNAEIDVLKMGDYIESKDLPFTYSDYSFSVDSVYTKLNAIQYVKANHIKIDKSNFDMINFRILPAQDAETHSKNKNKNNARYEVSVPKVNLKGTDWGVKDTEFYLKLAQVNIDSVDFHLLNKKSKKNQIVQNDSINHNMLPFHLEIEELNIKKSSFNSLNTFDIKNVNIQIKGITNKINEELHIKEFSLNNPQIVQIATKKNQTKKTHHGINLNDNIKIDLLKIKDAHYFLKDKNGKKNIITVNKFNLNLSNIVANQKTIKNKIPFTYQNPILSTGKVHYDTGDTYNLYANTIKINNNNVTISNLELKPKISKAAFNAKLKYGADYFNVNATTINLNNLDWGFDSKNVFYLKFNQVILNKVNASIYRNVSIPQKPGLNKLYSGKLRDINFGLDISNIKILNSTLTYQEDRYNSDGPGILTFTNFNANIKNIYSGYGRKNGATTTIDVASTFMNQAQVKVNWSFNIMNRNDSFNINGTVANLNADKMDPFLKPYLQVSTKGQINEVKFDFNGNNEIASGTFGMNYSNLNITLYKGHEQKERKLLSDLANLALLKNTHGKLIQSETKPVGRIQNKGFFNFFWLNLKQGIKQTIL